MLYFLASEFTFCVVSVQWDTASICRHMEAVRNRLSPNLRSYIPAIADWQGDGFTSVVDLNMLPTVARLERWSLMPGNLGMRSATVAVALDNV